MSMHAENANPIVYSAFMALSLIASLALLKLIQYPEKQNGIRVNGLIPILVLGALIGIKIPDILSYGWHKEFLWTAKSYYGALIGAFFGINFYKWIYGIKGHFGDRFIIPLCVGAGIGKVGCYFYGCCSGTATECILRVRNFTGMYVHPVQLYEALFEFICVAIFYKLYKSKLIPGNHFIVYVLLYMTFRFFIEFIRIEPRIVFGMTVYQVMSIIFIPFFGYLLFKRLRYASF